MKIVCESCGAKYSIADEKVAGKVFKIRCKKCSAVIVVKGDQPTASAGGAPAVDDGGDAIWHVVVAGEQQGPFAPRQIGELLAEGKIDWEAYVWREGMEGWQPAKDVPNLVSAVMAESESGDAAKATSSSAQAQDRFGPAGDFGGSGDMGADPFAGGDDGGLSGVIGQQPAPVSSVGGGADLFAESTRGAFAAAAASDDDEPGRAGGMTGQRNENSVLFSLSNLQALATGSGGGATPSTPKAGMAQGEGSGLIDIRALANATQAVPERAQASAASRAKVEDLLAVGSTGTSFSATSLAAPVAVEKREQGKGMFYAMGGAILALVGVVGFLVLREPAAQPSAQLTPPPEATPAAQGTQQQPGAATPAPTAPSTAPQAAEPSPSNAAGPTNQPEAEPDQGGTEEERSERGRDRRRRGERGQSAGKDEATTAAPAATPAPEVKPDRTKSSLDDLLDTALGGKGKPAKPASSENLPATPSRDDVLTAMKGVTPKVQACAGGQSGVATAKVTVAGPTGKVSGVEVTGQFAGTPVASCIAKEVGKAKFNRFSQVTFSYSFPFKL